MNTEELMRRAVELSFEGMRGGHGGPFGAVVVRNGFVIAEGFNRVLSSGDPTAHAEVVAIREAAKAIGDFRLAGCEIFTSCEPCPMCLGAIHWARIERVYFANDRQDAAAIGFDDELLYEELQRSIAERQMPMIRVASQSARAAFAEWLAMPDRRQY